LSIEEDYRSRLGTWSDVRDCLERLHDAAAAVPGVRVLELGVRSGNSTAAFLAAAEKAGGHVWSVDIAPPAVPAEWAQSGLWTFILGDDMIVSPDQREFDILFIDSSHRAKHTLDELQRYMPMVVPAGRVFLHDTRLDRVHDDGTEYPVKTALDAFCAETSLTWTDHEAQYGLGEIVIRA
jgi:predicted O-methyltransferase YrrM